MNKNNNIIKPAGGQTFLLPADLIGKPEDPVLLQVKGDGMQKAAILDRDYAVIDRKRTPKSGDIVIITAGGETALRRVFYEENGVRIRREDGITEDFVTDDYEIIGVMTGLIRQYTDVQG